MTGNLDGLEILIFFNIHERFVTNESVFQCLKLERSKESNEMY